MAKPKCPSKKLLLMHASGADISTWVRERQAAAVMMIPIPTRSVFKGVAGDDEALAVAGVEEVRITAKLDQLLEPLPEGDSYLGFIFAARGERGGSGLGTPSGAREADVSDRA